MKEKILALLRPSADTDLKLSVVSLFFAKAFESLYPRVESLESRQLQKGDKGEKGDSVVGPPGPRGPKGDSIVGPRGEVGPVGPSGKDAKPAKNGKDGVSIVDAEISMDDHLVLKRSDGKVIDAGELPKQALPSSVFVSGNGYQITVSSSAPLNPNINDLWFDVS